jgi:hypothetical protein
MTPKPIPFIWSLLKTIVIILIFRHHFYIPEKCIRTAVNQDQFALSNEYGAIKKPRPVIDQAGSCS